MMFVAYGWFGLLGLLMHSFTIDAHPSPITLSFTMYFSSNVLKSSSRISKTGENY